MTAPTVGRTAVLDQPAAVSAPVPLVATTRPELASALGRLRAAGRRIALVPTMGALHDGHAALLRAAREHAGAIVVTIFVNPLQFGRGEDIDSYPRTLGADLALCAREGVDVVFAPPPEVVYPHRPRVTVSAGALGELLEGRARPGHFDGVLTVVVKLCHLVRPDVAVFGEKDAQQLAVIRQLARDLDLPGTRDGEELRVVGVPTVRQPDGLALSSRNAYLSADERRHALALSRALRAGAAAAATGPATVVAAARVVLDAEPAVRVDYLCLVDTDTFLDVTPEATGRARLVVAGYVGATRLIDNTLVVLDRTAPAEPAEAAGRVG